MKRITTALCAAGLLALAGCGSSGSSTNTTSTQGAPGANVKISKATLISKGDAICTQTSARVRAITPPPPSNPANATASQLPAVAAYYEKAVPIYNSQLSSLRALGIPTSDAAQYAQFAGSLAGYVAALTAAGQEARAGQERAYKGAQDLVSRLSKATQTNGRAFGFTVCGTPY